MLAVTWNVSTFLLTHPLLGPVTQALAKNASYQQTGAQHKRENTAQTARDFPATSPPHGSAMMLNEGEAGAASLLVAVMRV